MRKSRMLIGTVLSRNNLPIRLTSERWDHILEGHGELKGRQDEVLQAVDHPDRILEDGDGALLAVRKSTRNYYLVAVYRELKDDGFIVTAFLTTRIGSLDKRRQLWP